MQNETRYYLINNTIKKGSEMPENIGFKSGIGYESHYKQWLSSLQPCEIDGKELANIKLWVNSWETNNPIDITDIVKMYHERCNDCEGMCYTSACENSKLKLRFKQPTEKQVESDAVYTEKQVDELIETICDRLRSGFFKSLELKKMSIDRIKNEDYKHWKNEIFKNRK